MKQILKEGRFLVIVMVIFLKTIFRYKGTIKYQFIDYLWTYVATNLMIFLIFLVIYGN